MTTKKGTHFSVRLFAEAHFFDMGDVCMKKLLSVLLAFIMMIGGLPFVLPSLNVEAEVNPSDGNQNGNNDMSIPQDDYIYYSDLFYNYSHYLQFSPILLGDFTAAQSAMNTAFNEYINSPNFILAAISQHISLTTNMSELIKAYTDYFGLTDFSYQGSLDAANIKFIEKLFVDEGGGTISDINEINSNSKFLKQAKSMLSTMQKCQKAIYDSAGGATYDNVYDLAFAELKLYCKHIVPRHVASLGSFYTAFAEVLNFADGVSEVMDLFNALIISVCMEDIRLSIIDDIIENAPTDSILYEGMTRLRSQLDAGWVSYFVDTYFTNKLVEQVANGIAKFLTKSIIDDAAYYVGATTLQTTAMMSVYGAISATISLINTAVFDWILGIPSIKDYLVTMILAQYSFTMRDCLVNKQSVFSAPFESVEVEKYEQLFNAYVASIKCALESCADLESDLFPLSDSTKETISNAKTPFEESEYCDYINSIKGIIKSISPELRQKTDFGNWNTNYYSIIISGPSDVIQEGYLYANHLKANIKREYQWNYSSTVSFAENQQIILDGSISIESQYMEIEIPDSVYLYLTGDLKFCCPGASGSSSYVVDNSGELVICGDFYLQGSYSYYFGGRKGVQFNNTGRIQVNHDMHLWCFADYFTNDGLFDFRNLGHLTNNGTLRVNHFTMIHDDGMPYSYPYFYQPESANIQIRGDVTIGTWAQNNQYIDATFNLCGTTPQSISGLKIKNLNVENDIVYESNVQIYGHFALNGHNLDNGSFVTECYDNATFDSISNYKQLYIAYQNQISLTHDITADFYGAEHGGLIIPVNTEVAIHGDVVLSKGKIFNNGKCQIFGSVSSSGYDGIIINDGNLVIFGNLCLLADGNGYHAKIVMSKQDSSLLLGGDLSLSSPNSTSSISAGQIILIGNRKQTIANQLNSQLVIPSLVIENDSEDGIVFECPLYSGYLFNHKQKKFALFNDGVGSSFVDYDGDGMKDNIDPYPTVGNPCTLYFLSANNEQGTVSIDSIQTIGGTEVTVTATPTCKYEFSKWIDSAGKTLSTDAEYTFVAKCDQTITAVFVKRKQPITVQAENGRINVVSSAEIESEVSVTVTENAGYIFDETSLKYNGITIENNKFIMPDEPVTITATFNRNAAYFALKEKIDEAAAIKYNNYSAESFAALTAALTAARAGLNNHISEQDSQQLIAVLQSAISGLSSKYPVSISVKNIPVLYVGIDNLRAQIVVTQHYDNNTSESVTDYIITGFDCNSLGEQQIEIMYNGFSTKYNITVQRRPLSFCEIVGITDIKYVKSSPAEQVLTITYQNGDVLTAGIDYEVQYTDNTKPGLAFIVISGIGNYTGTITEHFTINCDHQFAIIDDTPATCTLPGRTIEGCTICGAENETLREYDDLPESPHSYNNGTNETYVLSRMDATNYRIVFSKNTSFETNCDYLYIYNADEELIGTYTGTSLSGATINVGSSSVILVLKTDYSRTDYGFSFDYVDVTYDVEKVTESPALGHDYQSVITAPTCTTGGYTMYICSRCSDSYTADETAALGHNYDDWTQTKAPTCSEKGEERRTCSRCENSEIKEIDALGHDYLSLITAPTCTEGGYTSFTCSRCGDSYVTDKTSMLGHDFSDWIETKAPSCTEKGEEKRVCSRCDYTTYNEVSALGHDYVNHEAKAATCTEKGWDAYQTCSRCDYTTYEEIAALGHDFINHEAKAATCSEKGWKAYQTCSRCDYTTYEEISVLGHDLISHEAKAATCTGKGWDSYQTCTRCDYTTYEEIAALGHDFINHEAKAATCTEKGWKAYQTCSRCDYSSFTEINALGHDYSAWIISKEPTCSEEGEMIRVCKNDKNHIEKLTLSIVEHKDGNNDGACDFCGLEMAELCPSETCPLCGKYHSGFNGRIILFFHKLFLRFKQLFGTT